MRNAVIVDAVRSPMGKGKPGGALSSLHPVDLLGQTISGLFGRVDIDPGIVDDVIVGCVSQVGEQAAIGRMGWLAAGYPEHVPSVTIDRKCGSSQQAVHFAAQGVIAGSYDIAVAAGVESMSRIRMGLNRLDMDTAGPSVNERYAPGLVSQGIAAELVAARWKISREQLDALAAESHRRADETQQAGGFDGEIVPITVPTGDGGTAVVDRDESIRPGTSVEKLAGLKPAFEDAALHERYPQIEWSIHAGNSSQITDGASAMLIMSEEKAQELGLTPRARIHAMSVLGDDPLYMLTAPIPATTKVLERSGMTASDIDHFEVNEAFASVPLAWHAEFDVDPARLNPRGGAIALGHPLGASGCRLMTTMIAGLEQTGGRYGLQTMCEAGGMANATIVERLG